MKYTNLFESNVPPVHVFSDFLFYPCLFKHTHQYINCASLAGSGPAPTDELVAAAESALGGGGG
jgi:hypothetical protein